MTAPANLLHEWSRVLVGSLARAGVRHVVASPGSRSTPFLWAALETPELYVRTIADERSAAFFALGQAKLTGDPSVLLCTSGSAAANYLPALVEASESATPLVVLTADRPFRLHGGGAAQTIDQTRLFGAFAREFVDLGLPDDAPGALEALCRRVSHSVARSRAPLPGPVHLNARADKPLEPRRPESVDEWQLHEHADAVLARAPRIGAPRASVDRQALAEIASACREATRGLVVAGPLPAHGPRVRAATLARALGFQLLAEATSQVRFALDAPAGAPTDATPDVILQLGGFPVSGAWEQRLAAHANARLFVIAPHGHPDPLSRAEIVLTGPVAEAVDALIELAGAPAAEAANARIEPGHGAVAAAVDALPRGAVLTIGNSLPIRELEQCAPRSLEIRVVSQRGAAGIDGTLSLAAGAASVAGRPSALIVGDVSFLHDVGGLWAARDVEVPFAVVVVNNDGGRIFERLPIAELADDDRFRHWLTPHGFDLSHAAALYGHRFVRAETDAEVAAAVRNALERRGTTVIEARA